MGYHNQKTYCACSHAAVKDAGVWCVFKMIAVHITDAVVQHQREALQSEIGAVYVPRFQSIYAIPHAGSKQTRFVQYAGLHCGALHQQVEQHSPEAKHGERYVDRACVRV